jgi:BMFP domain-containing protein YqiC
MLPKNEHLEKFVAQATTLIDDVVGSDTQQKIKTDIESGLRELLKKTASNLDLVSREEFDAQSAVLARSQQKIDQLEQQLDELVQQLAKD